MGRGPEGKGSDEVLRDLLGLQDRLLRMFDPQPAAARRDGEAVAAHWVPPVDIYETDTSFVLVVEVPGVDQTAIELEVADDRLTLRGQRFIHTQAPDLSYYRIERPSGVFQRVFRLPQGVQAAAARAACSDGVLQVTVPKEGPSRGRSIAIEVAD